MKFMENCLKWLAHHIGQYIKTSTVRHTKNNFLYAVLTASFNHSLKSRDQCFCAIKAKTLGTNIFFSEIAFITFGFGELLQDRFLTFSRKMYFLIATFDALQDPAFFFSTVDVHKFNAKGRTVSSVDYFKYFTNCRTLKSKYIIKKNLTVQITIAKTVSFRIKFRVVRFLRKAERIKVCMKVATYPISTDHHQAANTIQGRFSNISVR